MAHEQHREQEPATRPAGARPERTPDERQILDIRARSLRRPLTEQEENFALDEAYAIGTI
jgi:hypothetical protein